MEAYMKFFLGRTLNTDTMMWEFPDGSGFPISDERKQAIEAMIDGTPESWLNVFYELLRLDKEYKEQQR